MLVRNITRFPHKGLLIRALASRPPKSAELIEFEKHALEKGGEVTIPDYLYADVLQQMLPTGGEITEANKFFQNHDVTFLGSFGHPREFKGHEAPEVAFVGRSNVGKSSLLNALTFSKSAIVSKTPGKEQKTLKIGRTQRVNLYGLSKPRSPDVLRLVDLPGKVFSFFFTKYEFVYVSVQRSVKTYS